MIVTPTDGLEVGSAQVPVSGGDLPVYFAAPKKAGKYATVIVIPEVFGMHEHIKDVARRMAKAGYYAITLDPFFRIGDGVDRKSTRLNSSHLGISYAVFCLKKKTNYRCVTIFRQAILEIVGNTSCYYV